MYRTAVSANRRPPALRIWDNPLIMQRIVEACPFRDHEQLTLVCKDFHSAVDRPSMWARNYALATIHPDLRTVFTVIEFTAHSEREQSPQKRLTKTFAGETWFIRSVSPPEYPTDPASVNKLDHTCQLAPYDFSAAYVGAINAQRQKAYSLLLNLGYLRAHGKEPSGRNDIKAAMALIPVLVGVLVVAVRACITSSPKANKSTPEIQFIQDMLSTFAIMAACVALPICIATVVYAPRLDPILNRYADDFYRHALKSIEQEAQRRSREAQHPKST